MRIEGAPRYHISTLLQTPPAFLVLSSHTYSALAARFRLFAVLLEFPKNLRRFLTGRALFLVLRATMWLQVEEVATTDFYWLKTCALHFQTSVGFPAFS